MATVVNGSAGSGAAGNLGAGHRRCLPPRTQESLTSEAPGIGQLAFIVEFATGSCPAAGEAMLPRYLRSKRCG